MTKTLDRRFRHVGRIKRAWGTNHKPTIRAMEQMMDGLFQRGRLDILRSIQDKTYSPLQVYDAWRTNDLERLPTAATLAPLKESMEKWIAKKECSQPHRLSLKQSLRHLLGTSNKATVAHLPTAVSALREKLQGVHPRSFNLARAAAQAYAKTAVGRNSKLWQDISAIEVLKVRPTRERHTVTPEELATITKKMRPEYANIVWGMATTGMGPSEFWGKWEIDHDRVRIHGTKRKARERVVPAIWPFYAPSVEYAAFRRALRDAGAIRPYDLRRTYATWLEAAQVPRNRRIQYMGHAGKDITDLYERRELDTYIAEDVDRLNRFVGAIAGLRLSVEKKA